MKALVHVLLGVALGGTNVLAMHLYLGYRDARIEAQVRALAEAEAEAEEKRRLEDDWYDYERRIC